MRVIAELSMLMEVSLVKMASNIEDLGLGGGNRTQTNYYLINPNITQELAVLISLRYPQLYPQNRWLLPDFIGS
jgi:hypothetical protein